jgi:integrase
MPVRSLSSHEHIYERISADGRLTGYQVKIRRVGFPDFTKTFDDLENAKAAVRRVLNDHDDGVRRDRLLAARVTLGDVLDREIAKRAKDSCIIKGKQSELYRLRAFKRDERALCQTALGSLTYHDFDDWKERRLEEVCAGTVLRELRLLRPILNDAVPRYHLLISPLHYVKSPSVHDERVARFAPGEEERLFEAITASSNTWLPLCAEFALETGCRRSEMLAAEWKDYDAKLGTIWLATSKNGRGRHLLLSVRAQEVIDGLSGREMGGRIFKIDREALKTAFERARSSCDMMHWRWHDFRHEAVSRAFDAGWTEAQVMDFSGHVDMKSLLRYRHPDTATAVARVRAAEADRKQKPTLRVVA